MANSFGRTIGVAFMLFSPATVVGRWLTGDVDEYIYGYAVLFLIGLAVFLAYMIKDRGTIWYLVGFIPTFPVVAGASTMMNMVFYGFRMDIAVITVALFMIGIILLMITLRYVDKDFKPKNMKKENDLV